MIPDSLSEALHKLDVFEAPENAPGKPTVLVSLLGVVAALDDYFATPVERDPYLSRRTANVEKMLIMPDCEGRGCSRERCGLYGCEVNALRYIAWHYRQRFDGIFSLLKTIIEKQRDGEAAKALAEVAKTALVVYQPSKYVAVPGEPAPVVPSGSQAANSDAAPETATSAATCLCGHPKYNHECGEPWHDGVCHFTHPNGSLCSCCRFTLQEEKA